MITLVQLEYLIAVDTYRHFATAAEKCFVTQPTLSMQLKKLEEDLGIIVFDRTKQPVVPTDAGKEIIEQARVVLREAKKVEEIVLKYKNILSGEVKIGIIPSLSPYLLPLFLGRMAKNYPQLQIQV
ncbi:MAG TPA: LysR family transcriptional regulator, partial [Cytophagaceae bacterium]